MAEPLVPPYCPPKPWLEREPWYPVDAPLKGELPRTPDRYRAVVDQFEVTAAKRYARRGKDTWCNIFTWDVTRAMGAEIPHWVELQTGAPVKAGKGSELRVDGMRHWLDGYGPKYGWRRCTRLEAELAAELGHPTVVLDQAEHVAVVVPVQGAKGIRITQAGASNFADGTLEQAWPAKTIPKLQFYTHE